MLHPPSERVVPSNDFSLEGTELPRRSVPQDLARPLLGREHDRRADRPSSSRYAPQQHEDEDITSSCLDGGSSATDDFPHCSEELHPSLPRLSQHHDSEEHRSSGGGRSNLQPRASLPFAVSTESFPARARQRRRTITEWMETALPAPVTSFYERVFSGELKRDVLRRLRPFFRRLRHFEDYVRARSALFRDLQADVVGGGGRVQRSLFEDLAPQTVKTVKRFGRSRLILRDDRKTKTEEGTGVRARGQSFFRSICGGGDHEAPWRQLDINVSRLSRPVRLLTSDAFHMLLGLTVRELLFFFVVAYWTVWFFFACVYYFLVPNEACALKLPSFRAALYLSIETTCTIGYGVPDPNFNHCWEMLVVLVAQVGGGGSSYVETGAEAMVWFFSDGGLEDGPFGR